MKTPLRCLLIVAAVFAVGNAYSTVPGVEVTVKSKSGGKALFKGSTDARGNFSTNALPPGSYSVEFRAPAAVDLKGKQLAISISTGKRTAPRQASASGNHLQAGVAVELQVSKSSKVTGAVVATGKAVVESTKAAPAGMEKVRANVKVMNGKRYVWVPGAIGSNIGGKWVEEGTDGAMISTSNKKGGDGEVLRRFQDGAGDVGTRYDGFGAPVGPGG